MGRKMYRGKQQILFSYLPGRTFDFERIGAIAQVSDVRGIACAELNANVVLQRIAQEARAWDEEFRPSLRDATLRDAGRFVLLDPKGVEATFFPRVLWCQNRRCGRVIDVSHWDGLPREPRECPACHEHSLVQIRFVKVHRCGTLQPLLPPMCRQCHSDRDMALDTRGSERISSFRWICRRCGRAEPVFAGFCRECEWPGDSKLRQMEIQVHRAGATFYVHSTVLLNIPYKTLNVLFGMQDWQGVVAAKYVGLPLMVDTRLSDYGRRIDRQAEDGSATISGTELEDLLALRSSDGLSNEDVLAQLQDLLASRKEANCDMSSSGFLKSVIEETGVDSDAWLSAGQELLETMIPLEMGRPRQLFDESPDSPGATAARTCGIERLTLLNEYPIVNASYGFTRSDYTPNQCRLCPFPPHRDHNGKFPVYVDQVQADALLITLNPERVCTWLTRNGFPPVLPAGGDPARSQLAYFVQLLQDTSLRETITAATSPHARMVFGLLHTFAHFCVRQAALLCGLDRTSLSEYLMPRSLTFAIYCNHRFGATIGALSALFEQTLPEWLNGIRNSRRCVYDPVCRESGGNCHACTHLAETSCRFFNLNLSRAFLFGGEDAELGQIDVGYFDSSLP